MIASATTIGTAFSIEQISFVHSRLSLFINHKYLKLLVQSYFFKDYLYRLNNYLGVKNPYVHGNEAQSKEWKNYIDEYFPPVSSSDYSSSFSFPMCSFRFKIFCVVSIFWVDLDELPSLAVSSLSEDKCFLRLSVTSSMFRVT